MKGCVTGVVVPASSVTVSQVTAVLPTVKQGAAPGRGRGPGGVRQGVS